MYGLLSEEEEKSSVCVCKRVYMCVCVLHISLQRAAHSLPPASSSGVDVQEEAGEDCLTEATTPTSFEPTTQSQMSTVELEESVSEDVTPSQEESGHADQDTSPAEDISPPEEEDSPAEAESDPAQPKEERDSDRREQPEGDTDSNSQSVDELLADWREDLEAFQQMEKDEL